MASSELVAQILADQQGVGFSPRENIYGQIGGTLASALPQLVSPYASTKSNIATVLGGSLLAGLLGYQARQEAEAQNQVLMPALTGIVGAGTQQEVADIYGQLPSDMQSRLQSTAINRLGAIQERELAQEAAKQKLHQDLLVEAVKTGRVDPSVLGVDIPRFPTEAEQIAADALAKTQAEFAALQSPEGQALAAKQQQNKIDEAIAIQKAKSQVMPVTTKQLISRQQSFANELLKSAKEYEDMKLGGIMRKLKELVPGSKADEELSKLLNLVPGVTKALGQAGNLNEEEQQRVLRAMLGGAIPSGTDTIAMRLTNTAEQLKRLSEDQQRIFAEFGGKDKTSREQFVSMFENTFNNPAATTALEMPKREDYPDIASYKQALIAYTTGD